MRVGDLVITWRDGEYDLWKVAKATLESTDPNVRDVKLRLPRSMAHAIVVRITRKYGVDAWDAAKALGAVSARVS
jgi:hypothetical protein